MDTSSSLAQWLDLEIIQTRHLISSTDARQVVRASMKLAVLRGIQTGLTSEQKAIEVDVTVINDILTATQRVITAIIRTSQGEDADIVEKLTNKAIEAIVSKLQAALGPNVRQIPGKSSELEKPKRRKKK